MKIPKLATERLKLRANVPSDFEAYAAFYASDRAILRGGIKSRPQAFIQFCAEIGHWDVRGYGFWAVEEKETGAYCGQVGCWFPDGWAAREIGWLVMAEHEGKGFAYEAAFKARQYAYEVLKWKEAASCISEGNERSIRLAERMGCKFERRHHRDGMPDHLVYRHPSPAALIEDH